MSNIVSIVFLLVLFLGCDSGGDADRMEWWGEVEAIKNNEPWAPVPAAMNVKRAGQPVPAAADSFVLKFSTYDENGFEQEHLGFGQLPRKMGIYALPKLTESNRLSAHVLYSVLDGGDAITDIYIPNESSDNWIAIDNYNPATEELEGRFHLLLIPELRTSQGAPDALKIEQGRFRTVIVKEWRECPDCPLFRDRAK